MGVTESASSTWRCLRRFRRSAAARLPSACCRTSSCRALFSACCAEDSQSVSQLRPAQGTVVGPASPGGIADTFQTTAGLPVPSGAEWPPCQAQLPGTLPALSAISANSANTTDSASSASDATLKERP